MTIRIPRPARKRCTGCGEIKPLYRFHRRKNRKDGRQSRCKDCKAEEQRQYCADHREGRNAYNRQWGQDNKAAKAEYKRSWYLNNREKALADARQQTLDARTKVFDHYGWFCACCSKTEPEIKITIDHIDGGGSKHRQEIFAHHKRPDRAAGINIYLWLIKNDFPEGFQSLCLDCNRSKGDGLHCRLPAH